MLRSTEWPQGSEFAWVDKSWPAKRGAKGWFEQYKTLMLRIRHAGRSRWLSRGWRRPTHFYVEPVTGYATLHASLARMPRLQLCSQAGRNCLLSLVGAFAGLGGDGVPGARAFKVKLGSVAALGYGRTLTHARKFREQQRFRGEVGSFGSLACPPLLSGRMVRVVGQDDEIDETAIATSLHTAKAFVCPKATGAHCWHAVRLYHRSRSMRAPESACERWGSLMHALWDSVAGWQPHRVISRLFLRDTRLMGSSHEDAVVAEIASALANQRGMDPYLRAERDADDGPDLEEGQVNTVLRRGVREDVVSRDDWKDRAAPRTLLPAARAAVRVALERGRGECLAPLPLFSENAQTVHKDRARSTISDALARWQKTSEAEEWRQSRHELFPGGGAAAEIRPREG